MHVLGIDIGGSSLKGAPVDLKTGRLLAERRRLPTPERLSPREMGRAVAALAREFAWEGPIGCGFPGVVDQGVVKFVGNLDPAFVGVNVQTLFRRSTRAPVSVINDADAAGLAEVRFGAGKGRMGSIVMLTFGTGVGSGLFLDGRLVPNTELGHVPLHGAAAERWVAASVKEQAGLSYAAWGRRVNEYLKWVVLLINPRLIIVGGAISAEHARWLKYITLKTKVVPARLRNDAGIVGAALSAER